MRIVRLCLNWIRWNWRWLKWPAALSLLAFLFHQNRAGFSDLAERTFHWPSYVIAFVLAAANVVAMFVRWYLLVRAQEFPFRLRDAFRIGFVGYIVFSFLGAGVLGGDIVRALLIIKEQQSRRTVAVATILFDRALGFITLLMIGAGAALFQMGEIAGSAQLKAITAFLWGGSIVGLVGLVLPLHPATSRWKFLGEIVRLPVVGRYLGELFGAVVLYQKKWRFVVGAVAVSLAGNLCGPPAFYFCGRALQTGPAAPNLPAHFLLIPAAVMAESTAPVPGGLGALEAAVQYCYATANDASATPVPSNEAAQAGFMTALAYRLLVLLISAIGVGYYLTTRKEVKHLRQEMRQSQDGKHARMNP